MDGQTPETPRPPFEPLDISSITNLEARKTVEFWLAQRNLNRGCYTLVPEDKFDFRVAEGFATSRENLTYQIKVHDNLLKCIKEGTLVFGKHYQELDLEGLTKEELLEVWDGIDRQIIEMLASEDPQRIIAVPEGFEPSLTGAVATLQGHEIYHIKENRSMLRTLKIPEFEGLWRMWGPNNAG